MIGRLFRKFRSLVGSVLFLGRNLIHARSISVIQQIQQDGLLIRGIKPSEVGMIDNLYAQLHEGSRLTLTRKLLYRLLGSRLCVAAFDIEGVAKSNGKLRLLGFNMFYFNPRDIKDHTIHSGFIGVAPEASGRGIATAMRHHVFQHFAINGIGGISSRISANNLASMAVAKKIGLKPVEEYWDDATGERRYYLKCDLKCYMQNNECSKNNKQT